MVHEPIDGCQRHSLVGENLAPFAERLVGRDEQGSAFIAGGDQLEQHTGLGLILGDVGDIVEDQQLVLVELGDGGLKPQLPARHLQPLDEVGGAHEQHAPAVLDERQTERRRKMALAAAGRAKEQDIGALIKPAVAGGERHDLRFADHGHGVEVEGVEGLARRQSRAGKMPLDAAPAAVGYLVFGECSQEAGRRPALLVRTRREGGPHQLDGGQAQLAQQEFDAGSFDGVVARHAAPSRPEAGSTTWTAASSS